MVFWEFAPLLSEGVGQSVDDDVEEIEWDWSRLRRREGREVWAPVEEERRFRLGLFGCFSVVVTWGSAMVN